jgi:cell division protein FtsI/penicillin-binding protein 2
MSFKIRLKVFPILSSQITWKHKQALNLQELKKALKNKLPEGVLGGLTGLQFKSHPQRSYPEEFLASNIIGFVNREGTRLFWC